MPEKYDDAKKSASLIREAIEKTRRGVRQRVINAAVRDGASKKQAAREFNETYTPLHDVDLRIACAEVIKELLISDVTERDLTLIEWRSRNHAHGGESYEIPWSAFGEAVAAQAEIVSIKDESPLFSPTRNIGGRKEDLAVTEMHMAVLDCDDAGDQDDVLAYLDELGLAYCWYQSHSAREGVNKWRLAMPWSEPFIVGEFAPKTWAKLYRLLRVLFGAVAGLRGDGFDAATDTLHNGWYWGSKQSEDDHPRKYVFREGKFLDLRGALALLEELEGESLEAVAVETYEEAEIGDGTSLLQLAFAHAGWLGAELEPGKYAVRCPHNDSHTAPGPLGPTDEPTSSTVLWPPQYALGDGSVYCSHSCGSMTAEEVLALLPPEAVEKATEEIEELRGIKAQPLMSVLRGLNKSRRNQTPIVTDTLPITLAETFMRFRGTDDADRRNLRYWRQGWWRWFPGKGYVGLSDVEITNEIGTFLDQARLETTNDEGETTLARLKGSTSQVKELRVAAMRTSHTFVDTNLSMPCWAASSEGYGQLHYRPRGKASEYLLLTNGALHLPSRTLHEPTPELFAQALPYAWDKDAECPLWLDFLRSQWKDDEESISCLQEMFGAVAAGDLTHQKIFLLIGKSRSGKSVIATTMGKMVGEANYTSCDIQQLGSRFGLSTWINKRAAIIFDAAAAVRNKPGIAARLKSISGRDPMYVDIKGKEPLTIRLDCQIVMAANEMPEIGDDSNALSNRYIALELTESFLGREDKKLESKIEKELPGILRWALDGYERLSARGHFKLPESSEDLLEEISNVQSPVSEFLNEFCETGGEAYIDEIWAKWMTWCVQQHIEPGNRTKLGLKIRALISVKRVRVRNGEKFKWKYVGVSLKK